MDEMAKSDREGLLTRFLSNGVRIVVRPVARSSYSASQTLHTTDFPLEKLRLRGYARRSWR